MIIALQVKMSKLSVCCTNFIGQILVYSLSRTLSVRCKWGKSAGEISLVTGAQTPYTCCQQDLALTLRAARDKKPKRGTRRGRRRDREMGEEKDREGRRHRGRVDLSREGNQSSAEGAEDFKEALCLGSGFSLSLNPSNFHVLYHSRRKSPQKQQWGST